MLGSIIRHGRHRSKKQYELLHEKIIEKANCSRHSAYPAEAFEHSSSFAPLYKINKSQNITVLYTEVCGLALVMGMRSMTVGSEGSGESRKVLQVH